MWISKKKWDEMESKVNELEGEMGRKKMEVFSLLKVHKTCTTCYPSKFEDGISARNILLCSGHNQNHIAQTDLIPDLTLEELARYIIDGKPIEREKEVKVKVEYGRE